MECSSDNNCEGEGTSGEFAKQALNKSNII
jgi:hypothetical protein